MFEYLNIFVELNTKLNLKKPNVLSDLTKTFCLIFLNKRAIYLFFYGIDMKDIIFTFITTYKIFLIIANQLQI